MEYRQIIAVAVMSVLWLDASSVVPSIFIALLGMPGPVNAAADPPYSLQQQVLDAESKLRREVMQRLTDQKRSGETKEIQTILAKSHSHAISRCNFFRNIAHTHGHDGDDAADDECVATLRMEVVELVSAAGNLTLTDERQGNDVHFCSDTIANRTEQCADPYPAFGEDVNKEEIDLRLHLLNTEGSLTEVENQMVLTAFDRAQADLSEMEGAECSFALSLRPNASPGWAAANCRAQQRSWLLWIIPFGVAEYER